MRLARWMLLAAAMAVAVCAKESLQDPTADCVSPSALDELETKIVDLQKSNAALQIQIDKHNTEKTQQLADRKQEHDLTVQKMNKEISALILDVEALKKDITTERQAVEKTKVDLQRTMDKLSAVSSRLKERESDLAKLEKILAAERSSSVHNDAELKAALAKLAEEVDRTAQLEKSKRSAEQKNTALLKDLNEAKATELSMASLLSLYYDEAMVLAEQAADFAQQKIGEQSGTLDQMQNTLSDAHKAARETTSQFYSNNLAATLNPILEDVHKTVTPILTDVHKAVNPHVEMYLPIVQSEAAKVKEQALMFLQEALRRAKLARRDAITLLEQNEHVAVHAQKVIDGVLLVLAVPLVLFQIRILLQLVVWFLSTTLCMLTCGLCCGSRKRGSKMKRKNGIKKTASITTSLNTPLNAPSKKTTTNKTTSTSQKRNKKGKN